MEKCGNCKEYKVSEFCKTFEPIHQSGRCSEIGLHIEISLRCGWEGGYVESIEVDDAFICRAYEPTTTDTGGE